MMAQKGKGMPGPVALPGKGAPQQQAAQPGPQLAQAALAPQPQPQPQAQAQQPAAAASASPAVKPLPEELSGRINAELRIPYTDYEMKVEPTEDLVVTHEAGPWLYAYVAGNKNRRGYILRDRFVQQRRPSMEGPVDEPRTRPGPLKNMPKGQGPAGSKGEGKAPQKGDGKDGKGFMKGDGKAPSKGDGKMMKGGKKG